jgi:single-strand DNA-binding protein
MSINRVNISGNLTRDPEMRATQAGTQILTFGVAVNDRRRNPQTGEWEDYPNYIDCVVFGNRAEPLSRFLSKGTKVAVEGKLRWSQWERDGQKRSKIEVIVDEVELPSRPQQGGDGYSQGGYGQPGGYAPAPQQAYSAPSYASPQFSAPEQGGYAPASQPAYAQPAAAAPQSAPAPMDQQYDDEIPF